MNKEGNSAEVDINDAMCLRPNVVFVTILQRQPTFLNSFFWAIKQ